MQVFINALGESSFPYSAMSYMLWIFITQVVNVLYTKCSPQILVCRSSFYVSLIAADRLDLRSESFFEKKKKKTRKEKAGLVCIPDRLLLNTRFGRFPWKTYFYRNHMRCTKTICCSTRQNKTVKGFYHIRIINMSKYYFLYLLRISNFLII